MVENIQTALQSCWDWILGNSDVPISYLFLVFGVYVGIFFSWWFIASKGRGKFSKKVLFIMGFLVFFGMPLLYLWAWVWQLVRLIFYGNAFEILGEAFLCNKHCNEAKMQFKSLFDYEKENLKRSN